MKRTIPGSPLAGALVFAVSLPANAQPPPDAPPRPVTLSAASDSAFRLPASLDGAPGKVALLQNKLSLEAVVPSRAYDQLRASASAEQLHYEFSSGASLLPGAGTLFENAWACRTDLSYIRVLDSSWTAVASGTLASAWEEGADPGDGLAAALRLGAARRFSDDLTLGLTANYQGRIEDEPYYFPMLLIDWKLSPRWSLRTEQKAGVGFAAPYAADDAGRLTIEPRVRYTSRRFRLDDGGLLPAGVIEDKRGAFDVVVRWAATPAVSVGAYAGLDVWQEFTIEDRRGGSRDELETGPVPFVGVVLQAAF